MSSLTIPMYHYVRPLKRSRFPGIKGLELELFEEQLAYFERHYEFVRVEQCLAALRGDQILPKNALLLTFDDGFIDHFEWVFPILDEKKVQGCFSPPARAILEKKLLDVHRIQFILASAKDLRSLVDRVFSLHAEFKNEFGVEGPETYYHRLAEPGRFDPAEVCYVKSLLQRELPQAMRERILDHLFAEWVSADETAFATELYVSMDQLRCMHRHGMAIASHCYRHEWLTSLGRDEQAKEIDLSLDFLSSVGVARRDWVMCYPYGACNDITLALLKERGCAMGMTTEVDIGRLQPDNALTLERLDTNDFPKDRNAGPNRWTQRVSGG
jgi:peptidoglycan/xylan/chitin deacetylase (PgdA/CDA1 family)